MRKAVGVGLVLLYVLAGVVAFSAGAVVGSYIQPPSAVQRMGDRP